ncbi:methyltransferase domain-containing protein [Actinomadura oligospora]|uniref:methyltransferase domain-containing protein n=1 Tax=Actinomadura oligospora TaxID=111804 RepID=UPI0004AFD7D4|nr:methyltransferase domain-containing protein [Actinomadura oligospora]
MSTRPPIDELADRLVDQLVREGHLRSGHWGAMLREVPRDHFVPDRAWCLPDTPDGAPHAIDRALKADRWLDAVYSDSAIITQVDDGAGDPADGKGRPTSSLSAPGVAIGFLELLGPQPGERILEIGTGTGWTAAALTHRVGSCGVTSIEVDPAVAVEAAANLASAGLVPGADVHLVVGDGTDGHPDHAPFDRVHVTCGVTTVPHTWITQTRPGGVIVLPWMPEHGDGRELRLVVQDDGRTAHGRFSGISSYMMLRGQRTRMPDIDPDGSERWSEARTRTDPRAIVWDGPGQDLMLTAAMPDVIIDKRLDMRDGTLRLEMATVDGTSQAVIESRWGGEHAQVRQLGDRSLWDEAEAARTRWLKAGKPDVSRYGLTVAPDGQYLWLDEPRGTDLRGRTAGA